MNSYSLKRGVCFVLFALFFYSSFSQGNTNGNLKGQNHLTDGVDRYRLLVKFSQDAILDFESGKPLFKSNSLAKKQMGANSLAAIYTFKQVVSFTAEEKKLLKTGSIPPPSPGKFDYFAFRGLVYVEEAESMNKEAVLKLANQFEEYSFVEYAALEPIAPILPPATPDFTSYQHYKFGVYTGQANVNGIDAEYAWSIGITGQGVKIADIEWGMDYQHEDLISSNFIEHVATTNHDYDDHGTAVAGIMIAKNNGFGVTGMVYGADKFYGVSEITNGRVTGITKGMQMLSAGDVFVYEMQTGGQNGEYVPADYNQAVWDITKTATDAGIIVVAAAGNGNQNLDDAFYASYRARGDNGSIRVGAGTKVGRNKASFSTYGSIVHLQGWGDWSVASTGYTSLYNGGAHANYTQDFSGTSSATPIVASAVVAVQSYSKTVRGITMTPLQMRDLLIQTGTPQGTGGHIGPLPNIKNAILQLQGTGNKLPVVSITAPSNNSTYTAPASITISADASDQDGTISKVEFYQGSTLLNSDASTPYSYNWTGIAAGTYSITAKANDNSGAVTTSTAITITVNSGVGCSAPAWNASTEYWGDASLGTGNGSVVSYNGRQYRALWWTQNNTPGSNSVWLDLGACPSNTAPSVSLTAPANNAIYAAASSITITANASDSDGSVAKVEFFSGNTKLGEDASSPYSFNWTNVAPGIYTITAKATDNLGLTATTSAITVYVNYNNANIAEGIYKITLKTNNKAIGLAGGSTDNNAQVVTSEYTGAAQQRWEIKKSTDGYYMFINANSDKAMDVPSCNSANGTILIQYTSLTNDCQKYFIVDLGGGDYRIVSKAGFKSVDGGVANTNGATTYLWDVANVDNQKWKLELLNTTATITAPATNTNYSAPATITINATASGADGTISKVEFYNGVTKLGEDLTAPYSFTWSNVAVGTYSITAKAIDNSNYSGTSTAITVKVNANQNPTVAITAPTNNTSYTAPATVNITAIASDADGSISKVEFYNGTTKLGEDATSPYTYAWTGVAAGTYSITAKAYDNGTGTATSSAVTIIVNAPVNQNPTVAITAPINNTTYTAPATVTIEATASDADGSISKVEFYNGVTKLGEDVTSPYTYPWTGVAAGTYSITAKAYDNSTGVATSNSITIVVNSATTGTENCSSVSPWNASAIYVKDDFVTYDNIKYQAKWWTTGENPSVKSGQWDVWIKLGECISGTAPFASPAITTIPDNGTTIDIAQTLQMNVLNLNSEFVQEVSYIIYKNQEAISVITKNGTEFSASWNALEIGTYQLQVIVKDNSGRLIYADAKTIDVSKTSSVNASSSAKAINFYPNPTMDVVNLSEGVNTIVIYDLSGNVMNRLEMNRSKQVSMSEYSAGVYLIQLITNNQSQFIKITKE